MLGRAGHTQLTRVPAAAAPTAGDQWGEKRKKKKKKSYPCRACHDLFNLCFNPNVLALDVLMYPTLIKPPAWSGYREGQSCLSLQMSALRGEKTCLQPERARAEAPAVHAVFPLSVTASGSHRISVECVNGFSFY